MEASSSFKPKGSFGVPEAMKRDLEAQRRRPQPEPQQAAVPADAQPQPAAPADARWVPPTPADLKPEDAKKIDEMSDEDRQTMYIEERGSLEKSLDTKIEEADIKEYIFKGRLSKEVTVVPGVMRCVFQTLTAEETMAIDSRLAELIDGPKKHTGEGIDNERTILNLCYSWVSAGGKPLAANNDPAKREGYIRKMGAHTLDLAANQLKKFNLLLRIVLREKEYIKK